MSPEVRAKRQEQAAYHEAGHMVAAADQGVIFDPRGLLIDAAGKGICFYCKDGEDSDSFRERLIVAAMGGWISNNYFGHFVPPFRDYEDDCPEVTRLLSGMSALRPVQSLWPWLERRTMQVVEKHSAAICALANELLAKDWQPREALNLSREWSQGQDEKCMSGEETASFLRKRNLSEASSKAQYRG